MASDSSLFDVCVICALEEEARAAIDVFSKEYSVEFQAGFSRQLRREYRYAEVSNGHGETIRVHLSWLPDYGPIQTAIHVQSVLAEIKPRFAAMVGICAGDKRDVNLGDLVVAERAFTYDSGKFYVGIDGRTEHHHDTNSRHPDQTTLQYVRLFDSWEETVAKLPRPISKRQQREWILNQLLATPSAKLQQF